MSRACRLSLRLLAIGAILAGHSGRAQTTFYEAWEAGLAHERAGAWTEARTSFQRAKVLHPEPGRRVRSYGLNFIEGYDPDLHLALAALRLGRLDEAAAHLAAAEEAGVSSLSEISTLQSDLAAAQSAQSAVTAAVPASPTAAAPTPLAAIALPPDPSPPAPSPPSPLPPGKTRDRPRSAVRPTAGPAAPPFMPPAATPATPVPLAPSPAASLPSSPGTRPASSGAAPAATGDRGESSDSGDRARPRSVAALAALAAAGAALLLSAAGALLLTLRRRRLASHGAAEPPPSPSSASLPTMTSSFGTDRSNVSDLAESAKAPVPFGAYVLTGVLGRGAMGSTWRAHRLRDDLAVAIKIPHEHVLELEDFATRFRREGSLGVTLHHPNIVRILEAGEVDGKPFIAMELLSGETLEKVLRREKRLAPRRALEVARGIALALDHAHLKGIVHRDLKPDNVMVVSDGTVKVMDYGIARQADMTALTGSFAFLGTPLYASPEALYSSDIDPRSDLYSLGIVLYRMLTGSVPFTGTTTLEVFHKHENEPLPPFPSDLDLPGDLFRVVGRLTAKSKDERFPSAEALILELDLLLHGM